MINEQYYYEMIELFISYLTLICNFKSYGIYFIFKYHIK